jgi:hypothetical protein
VDEIELFDKNQRPALPKTTSWRIFGIASHVRNTMKNPTVWMWQYAQCLDKN